MDRNKNYLLRSFIITLLIVIMLAGMFFLPRITLFDKTLRRVDILGDVLQKDSLGNVIAETKMDSMWGFVDSMNIAMAEPEVIKLDYKDSVPEGMVAIEDFADSTGVHRDMDKFYSALDETKNRQVRIAVFGDSYIEGDILTASLRNIMQKKYGGNGVGWVEVSCVSEGFRNTVVNHNSGWSKHHANDKGGYTSSMASLAGSYFIPSGEGKLTLSCQERQCPEKRSKCDQVSVWYDNTDALSMMLTLNDSISKDVDTNGYMGIQCHTTQMSNIKKVSLSARGGGVVYGICMDGKTGICVDNYSLRGSPGLHLAQLSDRFMQKIAEERPYDLIIFEYGLNVASKKRKDYSAYTDKFREVIQKFKSNFPMSSLLVFGASDRDERGNDGGYHTMRGVEELISYQRKLASDEGVAFWDMRQALGGDGSIAQLQSKGMAAKDFTHLNFKGGEHIAQILFDVLMNGKMNYDRRMGND